MPDGSPSGVFHLWSVVAGSGSGSLWGPRGGRRIVHGEGIDLLSHGLSLVNSISFKNELTST